MKLFSIELVRQSVWGTYQRFSYVVTIVFLGTLLAVYQIEAQEPSPWVEKLFQLCALVTPLLLAFKLFRERHPLRKTTVRYVISSITFLLLIYVFTLPSELSYIHYTRLSLMAVSFSLVISFAPYLSGGSSYYFWQFNQALFIKLLVSLLYSTVLYLGLAVALMTANHLFNLHFSADIYLSLFVVITGFLTTTLFLAGIPKEFENFEQMNHYPEEVHLFIQGILFPLVSLYLLILYGYAIKIVIEQDLPQSWATYLVIVLSITGIVSLLLLYPIQNEEDQAWMRTFTYWFCIALLPLTTLLCLAIGQRIVKYGVTESRYFVVAMTLWLFAMGLYFLINRIKNLKVIPISLCVVLLLSTLGPWSAFQVAEHSQVQRLKKLLQAKNLFKDEKIIPNQAAQTTLSDEEWFELGFIVHFLNKRGRLKVLQKYLHEDLDSLMQNELSPEAQEDKMLTLISQRTWSEKQGRSVYISEIHFSANKEEAVKSTKGFDYLIQFENYSQEGGQRQYQLDEQTIIVQANFEENKLQLKNPQNSQMLVDFDLNLTIQNLIDHFLENQENIPSSEMTLIEESPNYRAKLQISDLNLIRFTKKDSRCSGLKCQILLHFF